MEKGFILLLMRTTRLHKNTLDLISKVTGECTSVKSSPGNTRWERVEWGYRLKNRDSRLTFCMILWSITTDISPGWLCLSFLTTLKAIQPILLHSNRYMEIDNTKKTLFVIFIAFNCALFFRCWFWLCNYFLWFLSIYLDLFYLTFLYHSKICSNQFYFEMRCLYSKCLELKKNTYLIELNNCWFLI